MSRVIVLTGNTQLAQLVGFAAGEQLTALLPEEPLDPAAILAQASPHETPQAVVLDVPVGGERPLLDLAKTLAASHHLSVVIVHDDPAAIAYDALRAGVRDVLPSTVELPDMRTAVESALVMSKALLYAKAADDRSHDTSKGQVVAIVSSKGGAGKTAVAVNVATALANGYPHEVVLVDLDARFGDVASALSLSPATSLPDTVRGLARDDSMALKSLLTVYDNKLHIVPSSEDPLDADRITGEAISRLLRMLATQFRYVVVDTPPGLDEFVVTALTVATQMVSIAPLDVPGIRGMSKQMKALEQLDLLTSKMWVVVNKFDPKVGITLADVKASVGRDISVAIPRSDAMKNSINQGVPMVDAFPRDVAAKRLGELAQLIAPDLPVHKSQRHRLLTFGR